MRILLLILLLPTLARAELALSEVMANEPGGSVELEWIEVYNNSDSALALSNYRLMIGSDIINLPADTLWSAEFAVFARQLVADSGLLSFESFWGNGSGYWGDNPNENYQAIDLDFTLPNNSGSVVLRSIDGDYEDRCEWSFANPGGVSLERDDLEPPSSSWHQCADLAGSTPGRTNSQARLLVDAVTISVEPDLIRLSDDMPVEIAITAPAGSHALVEILDDTGYKFKTICDGAIDAFVRFYWDGRDNGGQSLKPGIYFVYIVISSDTDVTKISPMVIAP
jgi:hypothetical protein